MSLAVPGMLAIALAFLIASLSLLNGLLVHPYRYPNLQQLLLVRDSTPRRGAHQGRAIAVADLLDVRETIPAFARLTAWQPRALVISSANAEPERVEAAAVTANFLATLGVTPLLGRDFPSDADQAGHDDVVLLSRRMWNSRFGADASVVGRRIGLNNRPVAVVGIIGDEDCYPSGVDAWVPLVLTPADLTDRRTQRLAAIGRLKNGVTQRQAADQLTRLAGRLSASFPDTNRQRGFVLLPLQEEQYEFTAPLFLFVEAAALLVVLIAVVNANTLLVTKTMDRRKELAVRVMLGASARRIACLVSAEVAVLTTLAAGCAAWLAVGLLQSIRASLPEGIARWIAGWSSLHVDAASVIAGGAAWVLITIAIGTAVTMTSVRPVPESRGHLRATSRTTLGRRAFVAGQVGLAAALVLGASVMVAGFTRVSRAFASLSPERVLRFTLTLPDSRYPDATRVASFHQTLLNAIGDLPEVETVALIRNEPASNVPNPVVSLQREDAAVVQAADTPKADVEVVSPAAFTVLHLEMIEGRPISDGDRSDQPRVAVISRAAARQFWPDRDPVGGIIRLGTDAQPLRIVGIVSDFQLNWYDPEMRPIVFLPDAQFPARTTSVIVRTRTDPTSIARSVRDAVAALDSRQPLSEIESLRTTIDDSLSPIRIIERVLLAAGALSMLLAGTGIYGVLRHWVGSRQKELGVRLALGATEGSISRLVVREALLTATAGGLVGLAVTYMGVRASETVLLGVPSVDLRVLAFVAAAIVALTVIASLGPARRAARVDICRLLRLD